MYGALELIRLDSGFGIVSILSFQLVINGGERNGFFSQCPMRAHKMTTFMPVSHPNASESSHVHRHVKYPYLYQ